MQGTVTGRWVWHASSRHHRRHAPYSWRLRDVSTVTPRSPIGAYEVVSAQGHVIFTAATQAAASRLVEKWNTEAATESLLEP